jgi:hypothetical protein
MMVDGKDATALHRRWEGQSIACIRHGTRSDRKAAQDGAVFGLSDLGAVKRKQAGYYFGGLARFRRWRPAQPQDHDAPIWSARY